MSKPTAVPIRPVAFPDGVRTAITTAMDKNMPLFFMAKRANGDWEQSAFLPPSVTLHELIGAMEDAKIMLLRELEEDDIG